MKFDINFELPAEVQVQKGLTYTLKLIGGPEEYKKYLVEKELKLQEAKKAKEEAFLVKRDILSDIVLGAKEASSEALKESPTLEYYQTGTIKDAKPFNPATIGQAPYAAKPIKITTRAIKWLNALFEAAFEK